MGEKRSSKRHARRLRVRFGEAGAAGFPHSGFTNDVSATGLFVLTGSTPKPGTRLHLEVTMQNDRVLFMEGVVARQVVVPPELRQVVKAGFGVRYLLGTELMAEMVPALTATQRNDPFTLTFNDEEAWRATVDKELRRGGVFIWSANSAATNTILTVTFDLRFMDRKLAFEARVVHVVTAPDNKHGITLMFVDAAGAAAALNSTLGH